MALVSRVASVEARSLAVILPPQRQLRRPVDSARPPRWAVERRPLVRVLAVVDSDPSLNPSAVEGSVLPRHLRREVLEDWVAVEDLDLQRQHQHQHQEALVVHLGPLGANK